MLRKPLSVKRHETVDLSANNEERDSKNIPSRAVIIEIVRSYHGFVFNDKNWEKIPENPAMWQVYVA
jgi:hypothetical protein